MIVQFFMDEHPRSASIYETTGVRRNMIVAVLPNCPTQGAVDRRLAVLGFRRREKWQKCQWGYQASLRKRI